MTVIVKLGAAAIGACLVLAVAIPVRAEPPSAAVATSPSASESLPAPDASPAIMPVAPKPLVRPKPAITLRAIADLSRQTLTVADNGRTLATWPISSGVEDHATPRGVFQPEWTARMWYSRTYDNAPMPNAVFFKDGAAIHATQSTGALGRAASHGCVRLAPANAERFYDLVQKHGLAHTRISVFGTPPHAAKLADGGGKTARRVADVVPRRAVDGSFWEFLAGDHPHAAAIGSDSPFAANYSVRLPISAARYR